jgi:hypothetical protein
MDFLGAFHSFCCQFCCQGRYLLYGESREARNGAGSVDAGCRILPNPPFGINSVSGQSTSGLRRFFMLLYSNGQFYS